MTYPPAVDELLPRAHELAEKLGQTPSRNRLMRELQVGAPKAQALRESLLMASAAASRARRQLRTGAIRRSAGAWALAPRPNRARPGSKIAPATLPATPGLITTPLVAPHGHPAGPTRHATPAETHQPDPKPARQVAVWPVLPLALPAFVAIWGGWVGLGGLTGFGPVDLLPGFARDGAPLVTLNTAITLPIGMETYAAYALYVWLSGRVPNRAKQFAKWSAIASLVVGALGQVAYHQLVASGSTAAPWWITTAVSCLPVAVLGMGAGLAHLVRADES